MKEESKMKKIKVGIVGCGNISPRYFQACKRFESLDLFGCADMILARAQERAKEFDTRAFTVDALLDSDAEIIINLTIPKAHGELGLRALHSGKNIYNEKPLALARDEAQKMLATAKEKNLRVGGAPDTFLGAGLQTCRKIIDDGVIGEPIAATAFMLSPGPEPWHPDPEFFYQIGGGPMFDMGPYYVTAMTSLIGAVKSVVGMTRATFSERTIGSGAKKGQTIPVNVQTHIAGVLQFENGAIGTLVTSFDIKGYQIGLEIHGTHGSIRCPDPNTFGGPVFVRKMGERDWSEVKLTHNYEGEARGIGTADMAVAIQTGRAHRANGELTYHTLDIMHALHDAAREQRQVTLKSSMTRPSPLPMNLADGQLDE